MVDTASCPCGSRRPIADCCGPALAGEPVTTSEQLMRSRFTAFALRDSTYLLRSWHPRTRPKRLVLDDLAGTEWLRLQIVDTVAGGEADSDGVVEFRAVYRDENGRGVLHERSRFERDGGEWRYVDGVLLD